MTNITRTRIGPSPTGYPHIGTVYQALFDKAWAVKNDGVFVLRIEDTDQARYVEESEGAIYDALGWFGLTPDESPEFPGDYGPYRQSERLELYLEYVRQLIEKGHAYRCFCSKERLDEVRKKMQKDGQSPMYDKHCRNLSEEEVEKRIENGDKYVVRMKVPENEKIIVTDLVRGDIEFDSSTVDDQVILKSDGFPTYHLAVVVDDHLMKITDIVRGPEWITSFPKHKILYDYFGWKMPNVLHTPMITNMDGSKLGKRNGHSSVDWYRRKGFLPEAVLNFISLLGWSHPEEKEIFSLNEFIDKFDIKDVGAVSPKFDITKLEWMNSQYIKEMDDLALMIRLDEWLTHCVNTEYMGVGEFETEWTEKDYSQFTMFISKLEDKEKKVFIDMNKERIKTFEDLLPLNQFFLKVDILDDDLLTRFKDFSDVKIHLNWVMGKIQAAGWDMESLKRVEREIVERADEINWKVNEVFHPIRIAVCRNKVSPPLFESIYVLGKEETVRRLRSVTNV